MTDRYARTMDLIAQATLMDDTAASAFLTERIDTEGISNGQLLLALTWVDPQEARKRCQSYAGSDELDSIIAQRVKALLEAQELARKSSEEQAAYHVMAALRYPGTKDEWEYELLCLYMQAIESQDWFFTSDGWLEWPIDIPLSMHLFHDSPEEAETKVMDEWAKRSGDKGWEKGVIGKWGERFCFARLLFLVYDKTPPEGRELVRLVRLYRQFMGTRQDSTEVYAVIRVLDWLERNDPKWLPELLPQLLRYYHAPEIGGIRLFLRVRVLAIIAPWGGDSAELEKLMYAGLEDSGIREHLWSWSERIGGAFRTSVVLDEETRLFASQELVSLRQILQRGLA